jgi:hypothetical protein
MRIRTRLQPLEQWASVARAGEDTDVVEMWIPDDGRGGRPPGRYPCEGTQNMLIICEPTPASPLGEALS